MRFYQGFVNRYKAIIDKQSYYEDDKVYVCKVSYLHNSWLPIELQNNAEKMKREIIKNWSMFIWWKM
ncbi:MAG: phage terminase large subunit [Arsenophonus sp. NEOnobi-MAG3]